MPETLNDAKSVVEKWEAAAKKISGAGDISDTVGGHALQDKSALSDEKWLGTEEEERFAYVFAFRVLL
jgi:phospholipase D1/2